MKDWRYFDKPAGWNTATHAERIAYASQKTVEIFKKVGLYEGELIDKTRFRRLTMEQMREEDEALDRLIESRLASLNRENQ